MLTPLNRRMGLVSNLLREGKPVRLRAYGSSMVPAIHPGDTLTIEPARQPDIERGDVVLFSQRGQLVAHRVINLDPITTRGDAFSASDASIDAEGLLGRVTRVEKQRFARLGRIARRIYRVLRGGAGI